MSHKYKVKITSHDYPIGKIKNMVTKYQKEKSQGLMESVGELMKDFKKKGNKRKRKRRKISGGKKSKYNVKMARKFRRTRRKRGAGGTGPRKAPKRGTDTSGRCDVDWDCAEGYTCKVVDKMTGRRECKQLGGGRRRTRRGGSGSAGKPRGTKEAGDYCSNTWDCAQNLICKNVEGQMKCAEDYLEGKGGRRRTRRKRGTGGPTKEEAEQDKARTCSSIHSKLSIAKKEKKPQSVIDNLQSTLDWCNETYFTSSTDASGGRKRSRRKRRRRTKKRKSRRRKKRTRRRRRKKR